MKYPVMPEDAVMIGFIDKDGLSFIIELTQDNFEEVENYIKAVIASAND